METNGVYIINMITAFETTRSNYENEHTTFLKLNTFSIVSYIMS